MTLVALFATLALAALPSGMQDSAGALSRLPGSAGEPALAVRHGEGAGDVVLYVHGSTFPSASSVAWRVDGWSWMDDLNARGFDVWAFDFAGYGGSDRPAAMAAPPQGSPIGRAEDGALQIARVVDHIRHLRPDARISIIAHSWGTMPAGLYVTRHPAEIARLVLFGPPALRTNEPGGETPAWEDVTVERQRRSFRSGIPAGAASVIDPDVFDAWAEAWLATDPQSRDRTPPAVRVPGGPGADIDAAWSGRFPVGPRPGDRADPYNQR